MLKLDRDPPVLVVPPFEAWQTWESQESISATMPTGAVLTATVSDSYRGPACVIHRQYEDQCVLVGFDCEDTLDTAKTRAWRGMRLWAHFYEGVRDDELVSESMAKVDKAGR